MWTECLAWCGTGFDMLGRGTSEFRTFFVLLGSAEISRDLRLNFVRSMWRWGSLHNPCRAAARPRTRPQTRPRIGITLTLASDIHCSVQESPTALKQRTFPLRRYVSGFQTPTLLVHIAMRAHGIASATTSFLPSTASPSPWLRPLRCFGVDRLAAAWQELRALVSLVLCRAPSATHRLESPAKGGIRLQTPRTRASKPHGPGH